MEAAIQLRQRPASGTTHWPWKKFGPTILVSSCAWLAGVHWRARARSRQLTICRLSWHKRAFGYRPLMPIRSGKTSCGPVVWGPVGL